VDLKVLAGIPLQDEAAQSTATVPVFVRIFLPLINKWVGVAAFFCFMFSWVELLLARTLTSGMPNPLWPP
jgi:ABC-type glycerol-3-phosphate transport system permease component